MASITVDLWNKDGYRDADAIGRGCLKATAKGNRPRQFSQEAAQAYWEASPDKALLGGINTEPDFFDLHTVRIVACMAGLIRKYKDRFILTKKCRLAMENGMGSVYLEIFRTYAQTFNWAFRDRYPDLAIVQHPFLYTLYLLHSTAASSDRGNSIRRSSFRPFP